METHGVRAPTNRPSPSALPPPDPLALLVASNWFLSLPIEDFVQTVNSALDENALATPQKTEPTRRDPRLAVGPENENSGTRVRLETRAPPRSPVPTLTMDDVARLQHLCLRDAAAAVGVGETKVRQACAERVFYDTAASRAD